MGRITTALLVFLAVPATALAQDFGVEWIDRVTRERYQDRGPLKPKPVDVTFSGGVAVYHDDNIFLEERSEESDTITIPFAGARLEYSEPQFDAVADFLGNYKAYSDNDEVNDHEQRFFGRARYVGARLSGEAALLVRNESDPIDAVLIERAERLVADAAPRFTYDISRTLAFEGSANIEMVRFEENVFRAIENNNYRADGSLVYRLANGYDWLAQGGWILIDYEEKQSRGGTADADGAYGRVGFRGEPNPRVSIEALIGVISVKSRKFLGTSEREEENTVDALVRTRWLPVERLTLGLDFTRTITFAGADDPFQIVNRFVGLAEYEAIENLRLRARVQYDRTQSALGIDRTFLSAGGGASYRFLEWISAEGGVTFRDGEVSGDVVTDTEFDNLIFHFGVVLTY
jgi:hypothetical protein